METQANALSGWLQEYPRLLSAWNEKVVPRCTWPAIRLSHPCCDHRAQHMGQCAAQTPMLTAQHRALTAQH